MATKYYGIKDNWTDDDVANVIEVASEDGSVSSVKVNGVEYGGGGGDFSTAEVTFIDTDGEGYVVRAPFVLEGDEYIDQGGLLPEGVTPASSIYPYYFTDSFSDPVKVALYKNSAYVDFGGPIVSVSGSATILDLNNTIVQITGDCTITVS